MAECKPPQQDGVLVLNKPKGPSSGTCIGWVKRKLGQKKIGHAGTLDPMASGVLIVLLGQGTKLSGHLMGSGEKTYVGTLKLGETTDTWDAEGDIIATASTAHISKDDVRQDVASWLTLTEQEVPSYSAAKHKGTSLYKLARKGKETPVKVKPIKISHAEVLAVDLPQVRFRVRCSTGTYIRSLAHSLGIRLQSGAVLTELIREYSHPFSLDEAHDIEEILAAPERFAKRVIPLDKALPDWPKLQLTAQQADRVKNGIPVPYDPEAVAHMPFTEGIPAMLLDAEGGPLALAEAGFFRDEPHWTIVRGLWR